MPASAVPPSIQALSTELDDADDQLHPVYKQLRGQSLDEEAFRKAIAAIPPVKSSLNDAISELSPRLESIDARLAELGPAPAAGAPPDPADIAHNRANLTRFRGIVDADIKRARYLSVEADQLSAGLSERARMLFSARLWTRSASVISPALWQGFFTALPGDFTKLGTLFGDEGRPARPLRPRRSFRAGLDRRRDHRLPDPDPAAPRLERVRLPRRGALHAQHPLSPVGPGGVDRAGLRLDAARGGGWCCRPPSATWTA